MYIYVGKFLEHLLKDLMGESLLGDHNQKSTSWQYFNLQFNL
jgi:hypothetical protein